MCFVISNSNDLSLSGTCRRTKQGPYSSTPWRSNSVSIASKTIPAGTTAMLVQKMIAAREAIRYSIMRRLLLMRDGSFD
jgi:hypothetical protein